MKSMKKIASLVLALVMALALAVPAMAEENAPASGPAPGETGTITIDNALVGETYKIYKMFSLESYSDVTSNDNTEFGTDWSGNFSYKVVDAWRSFFAEGAPGATYVTVDADGYVTGTKQNMDAAAFAKAALEWVKENNITSTREATEVKSETVEFTGLELGYYLVDSSAGALCSLNTTAPNVTIKEKNTAPTLDKQVQEDSTKAWGETNDADIGQTVNFKVTIHAKKGATNYVMHDKMSEGLTFGEVTAVKVGDTKLALGDNYTVKSSELNDDCTFEVAFTQSYLDTLTADTDIVVEYTATLNENAVIAGTGNDNDAKLTYGDSQKTEWKNTKTYTWKFDLHKYTGELTNSEALAGAKFELRTDAGDENTALYFTKSTDGITYTLSDAAAEGATKEIVTVENKDIILNGLDAATYYLVETEAPDGYNKLTTAVEIQIESTESGETNSKTLSATIKQDGASLENSTIINVQNNTGVALPETGGIGTTIFYVVGSVLALGAVILLVTKKRMSAK